MKDWYNNLFVNFTSPDAVTIHLGEEDGNPCIEIIFKGAARHLTQRAKAEVVMATHAKYVSESLRLENRTLGVSDTMEQDGSIGRETEVSRFAHPVTGETFRVKGLVNRTTDSKRKLSDQEVTTLEKR